MNLCLISAFKTIFTAKNTSYREIEKVLTCYAVLRNLQNDQMFNSDFQRMMAFVCYLKIAYPAILIKIKNNTIDAKEIIDTIGLSVDKDNSESYKIESLIQHIQYDLGDQEVKQKMEQEGLVTPNRYATAWQTSSIISISKSLSTFKMN